MSTVNALSVSSYVILGLLEQCGAATPYELKKLVDGSIGYFWDFPRAQLYVDPERLRELGLVTEEREAAGRRRKRYHITPAGHEQLRQWLVDFTPEPVEMRDAGLLKLFFGHLLDREQVIAMARAQAATHRRRLAEYERIAATFPDAPGKFFNLATLRMGLEYERLSISYWDDIAAQPPRADAPPRRP